MFYTICNYNKMPQFVINMNKNAFKKHTTLLNDIWGNIQIRFVPKKVQPLWHYFLFLHVLITITIKI